MSERPTELVVVRHAYTKKGEARGKGSHLSSEGVELAKRVGESLGRFDLVYARSIPRAVETAIAMGFAVDDTIDFACSYVPGEFEHHEQWEWPHPYIEFKKRVTSSTSRLATTAAMDCNRWVQIAQSLPAGGRGLIVSSGGSIEPVLVYCCLDSDMGSWGKPLSHCDAVTMVFDGTGLSSPQIIRAIPDES